MICTTPISDVPEYLADEVPGGESLATEDLVFLRIADVEGTHDWIWRFREPDGDNAYATVALASDGSQVLGYEANYYGLTPEQFILGDYHQVF